MRQKHKEKVEKKEDLPIVSKQEARIRPVHADTTICSTGGDSCSSVRELDVVSQPVLYCVPQFVIIHDRLLDEKQRAAKV